MAEVSLEEIHYFSARGEQLEISSPKTIPDYFTQLQHAKYITAMHYITKINTKRLFKPHHIRTKRERNAHLFIWCPLQQVLKCRLNILSKSLSKDILVHTKLVS